eukprot:g76593.t1
MLCRSVPRLMTQVAPSVHSSAVQGFTQPDMYERGRPDYTRQSIEVLFKQLASQPLQHSEFPFTVLDVGAGTGKFAAAIEEYAPIPVHVIAVEPVKAMRHTMRQKRPSTPVYAGSADSLPVASSSVHAVVAGQAFHWFATPAALKEFARVLVPRGRLGLMFNERDVSASPFVARLEKELDKWYPACTPRQRNLEWKKVFNPPTYFTPLEETHLTRTLHRSVPTLLDMIMSISVIAERSEQERSVIRHTFESLTKEYHPEVADTDSSTLCLPYVTSIYWCSKR